MSIASNKKRQRPATPPSASETPGRPRRKRRLTVLVVLALGLALLVALLPTIIVQTPLLTYLVRRTVALDGTVTFRSASLGWCTPASISGIEIRDAQGATVLEAESLTCDRSLLKLLCNSSNVGTLRIDKPRLNVKLARDGSNLQSVFAPAQAGPSSSPHRSVDMKLEVVDGEATIVDQDMQQSWHVTDLQLAYSSSLAPAGGEGSAALRFDGANLYGFQIGPGQIKLHLADGVLRAEPLELSCNQGRLLLQPELCIDRQPMEFRLSAGTLASQIQLDPAACHSGLKYVVPVLASVTQSEGRFSIELEGCRVPLGDLSQAEIAGRIVVHSAAMNPGPLVEQLASLASASLPPLVHIEPESVILFRMTGGRIYHQGLALQFPDVTMRTYGSVGLDESLKLMVETSVPLTWLPSNAVTDAIRKQKMQLPLGGTLMSPQLDGVELARVKKQLFGNLGVLESELGSQLNRFLRY